MSYLPVLIFTCELFLHIFCPCPIEETLQMSLEGIWQPRSVAKIEWYHRSLKECLYRKERNKQTNKPLSSLFPSLISQKRYILSRTISCKDHSQVQPRELNRGEKQQVSVPKIHQTKKTEASQMLMVQALEIFYQSLLVIYIYLLKVLAWVWISMTTKSKKNICIQNWWET